MKLVVEFTHRPSHQTVTERGTVVGFLSDDRVAYAVIVCGDSLIEHPLKECKVVYADFSVGTRALSD